MKYCDKIGCDRTDVMPVYFALQLSTHDADAKTLADAEAMLMADVVSKGFGATPLEIKYTEDGRPCIAFRVDACDEHWPDLGPVEDNDAPPTKENTP